jgi:hypothetical protein
MNQALINGLGPVKARRVFSSVSKSGLGCSGILVKEAMDASNFIKVWLQNMNPGIIGEGDIYDSYELIPGVIHSMDINKLEITQTTGLEVVLFNPYNTMQSITAFTDHADTLITTGNFVTGISYEITTAGDTTWTDIGAVDNNVGTEFVATGLGGGTTGVAKTVGTVQAACVRHEKLINDTVRIEGSTNFDNTAPANPTYPVGIVDADNFYFPATWVLDTITSGNFVVGRTYTIVSAGTTNFTLIGAADSNPATEFTATGIGIGTGTASLVEIGRFW